MMLYSTPYVSNDDSKLLNIKYSQTIDIIMCVRLRNSRRVFHERSLLERCFQGLVLPFWRTVLQCGARMPIHTINY